MHLLLEWGRHIAIVITKKREIKKRITETESLSAIILLEGKRKILILLFNIWNIKNLLVYIPNLISRLACTNIFFTDFNIKTES